jgi:dCTP deaminase
MSILSDRQIRELCVAPERYLDQKMFEEESRKPISVPAVFPNDHHVRRIRQEVRERCMKPMTDEMKAAFRPMISPFELKAIREIREEDVLIEGATTGDGIRFGKNRKIISYGTTSYGYDVRLGEEFQIFTNINGGLIDPKRLDKTQCLVETVTRVDEDGSRYVILPPNSYLLGVTPEYFKMPRDVLAICMGKSTYARAGAHVNVTPIEPGFEGQVVIEVSNGTSLPMKIYANEGISQFCFFRGTEPCETSYADKDGKYMGQTGIQLGKV